MTPLRQRMFEDMQLRNLASGTQASYVRAVAQFARYFMLSPEVLEHKHVRQYLLYLIQERHLSRSSCNVARSAIQFLYRVTLGRDGPVHNIPCARNKKRLPVVLSQEELRRFFAAILNPRHTAIFLTAYGTGLRAEELTALRIRDIDSGQMLIGVNLGKGDKDRFVKLSPFLLKSLRDYYRACRPADLLFPGRGGRQMAPESITRAAEDIARRAGIGKKVGSHTFRHTYATHMLDAGADLVTIQALMGHGSLRTTAIYLHVSKAKINAAPSPLDQLFAGLAAAMTRVPASTPELADVVRQFSPLMPELPGEQRRVLSDIAVCRTAALGGHLETCDCCGHQRPAYNSCRNRHCPKCQASACADWLDEQAADLLPVPYFHVVFTLPNAFNSLALGNKRVVYGLLFKAVARTLLQVAADPKHLGAQIGFLAVLHTWGQNLSLHPHLHCVIPGGGLSPDGTQWVGCRGNFFLPVRVLSRVFRGKFISLLRKAFHTGKLHGPADAAALEALFNSAVVKDWVVYAKRPFGGPEQVLKYLARYTHRIAISNRRIVAMDQRTVTFEYKDYAGGNRRRTMKLPGTEFLRRFLMHSVPRGFMRIRHFGLLANRSKADKLERCRQLLGVTSPSEAEPSDSGGEPLEHHDRCPVCARGRMVPAGLLQPRHDQLPNLFNDTS